MSMSLQHFSVHRSAEGNPGEHSSQHRTPGQPSGSVSAKSYPCLLPSTPGTTPSPDLQPRHCFFHGFVQPCAKLDVYRLTHFSWQCQETNVTMPAFWRGA